MLFHKNINQNKDHMVILNTMISQKSAFMDFFGSN